MAADYIDAYRSEGFAIVRGVFPRSEIEALGREAERIRADAARLGASYRHGNVLYIVQKDERGQPLLRFVQWPSYFSPVMAKYRNEPRLLAILRPLIGQDLKQIINQIIWKPPGSRLTTYAYHQDSRFRRPASAYRDLANSFVQTAIAIDAHHEANGGLKLVRRSHLCGVLPLRAEKSIYEQADDPGDLAAVGLDGRDVVTLDMKPGDVALWHPHAVHGSGPNLTTGDRRVYLNGFVIADKCDRGEWAFRAGQRVDLGDPVLVQYEDLYTRPEPHFIDGPPHPFAGE